MARFSFTSIGNSHHIEVFPLGKDSEAFFRAEISPFKYLPAFPFSTNMSKYVGMDLRLAQPPLPATPSSQKGDGLSVNGESEDQLICGTETWKIAVPEMWGKAKCCWVNLPQELCNEEAERRPLLTSELNSSSGPSDGDVGKMWPAYNPFKFGILMENATFNFTDGKEGGIGI
jgi:hypothetical protein